MALYAFDGTGEHWNPGAFWNLNNLRKFDERQKHDLLKTIKPDSKTDKDRYLTNVVFFYKEYVKSGLHAEYFPGVGSGASFKTKTGITLDFIFGGAFGFGAQGIVNKAFKRLKENFELGDKVIDIVGYSRGAAISCMFADKIFRDYKKLSNLTQPPEIRFVGLFDTVASFGNPLNDNEVFFRSNLPSNVQNAFHAMSLDLNSPGFKLDRVYGANVLEVWFRGGHGDIGGNSSLGDEPNRARTNITLNFMLKKAIAVNVELKDLNLSSNSISNQDLSYPFDIKAPISVAGTPRGDISRQPRKYDIFHYSFFDENNVEIKPRIIGNNISIQLNLEERDRLVIEELVNESEVSKQQLLQLTPALIEKFPNTQALYDCLYGCELKSE
jgi:Uncharacterized alpha/beta hydrolase domain (DUF2235)